MSQDKKTTEPEKLAGEIMEISGSMLLVKLRFLEPAFFKIQLIPDPDVTYASDGWTIRYGFLHVLRSYRAGKGMVVHDYLHMILHCIFRHPFVGKNVDPDLWNLACDIAVEACIMELNLPETASPRDALMRQTLRELKSRVPAFSAEILYHYFRDFQMMPEELETIREPFLADEHDLWYEHSEEEADAESDPEDPETEDSETDNQDENSGGESGMQDLSGNESEGKSETESTEREDSEEQKKNPQPARNELEKEWSELSARIQTDLETTSSKWGEKAGTILRNLKECNREKVDYRKFLRQFSVFGETVKTNDEEFDYIYYTYGLQVYGNVPLVEPLEYKEVKRIRDFVIVLDTSASVDGELVQSFVEKTWNILSEEETFFTRINLHLIQADTKVEEDRKITNRDEMNEYLKTMQLHGFGGTDFRPAFSYVDEMIRRHEFTNLKGLLYFTDGEGTFPVEQPDYRTAFVFVDTGTNRENCEEIRVPVWAIKVILDQDEIREERKV